jgi:hypothetical protein
MPPEWADDFVGHDLGVTAGPASAATSYAAASVRPRWRRRLLVAVVVSVALLVAVDRISLIVAERVAASTIQQSQHLQHKPSVSVRGFPFLTQLVSGSYDDIEVVAHDVEVGTSIRPLRVMTVAVRLESVTITNNFRTVHAKRALATASIGYADLSTTLGATVSYAGAGRVVASAGISVAGVPLQGSISALPQVSSSAELTFADTRVSFAGAALPPQLDSALAAIFGHSIPLDGLPFGLRYVGLTAGKSGIALRLAGQNLAYQRA